MSRCKRCSEDVTGNLSVDAVWSKDRKPDGASGQTASSQRPGSSPHLHHQLPGKGAPTSSSPLSFSLFTACFSLFILERTAAKISSPVSPVLWFFFFVLFPLSLSVPYLYSFLFFSTSCFTAAFLSLPRTSSPYSINIYARASECADFYFWQNNLISLSVCSQKALQLKSDEHIFKFIKSKFGLGPTRYDFPCTNIYTHIYIGRFFYFIIESHTSAL